MPSILGSRKGGSSTARAQRAKTGHKRRKAKLFTSGNYRGHPSKRTKGSWII